MDDPRKRDWVRMIAATALWALFGALALSMTDDMAVTGSICVGWLIGYGVVMALLSRPKATLPAVAGGGLFAFTVFGYGFAVMMGVGSGPN